MRTILTFLIEDEQPDNPPDVVDYAGVFPALDLELEGLSLSDDQQLGTQRPVFREGSTPAPDTIVGFNQELFFGPVSDPSGPVGVRINQLWFTATDPNDPKGGLQALEGSWEFTFTPSVVSDVKTTVVEVGVSQQADGVTFEVDSLALSALETVMMYRIDSERPGHLEETDIVAQLPDGSYVHPLRIESNDGLHMAHFEPFPASAEIQLIMPAALAEVAGPVSIDIPIQGPITDVIQVDRAVSVATDRLTITEIGPRADGADEPGLSIRIENETPDRAGRILLFMPPASPGAPAALTDDLGKSYEFDGGNTNLSKSSPVEMWAGGSSFTFVGEVSAGASRLTLTVDSYARMLGPWRVSVQMPGE